VRFSQATVGEANTIVRQITAAFERRAAQSGKVRGEAQALPKCKRALGKNTEVCPACVNKRAVMLRLFRFLVPYKEAGGSHQRHYHPGTTIVGLVPSPYINGRLVDELSISWPRISTTCGRSSATLAILFGAALCSAVMTYGARRVAVIPWRAGIYGHTASTLYDKFNQLSPRLLR